MHAMHLGLAVLGGGFRDCRARPWPVGLGVMALSNELNSEAAGGGTRGLGW